MRKRTMIVHANPYAHIDANGRLAGATPIAEPVRSTTTPPTREFVGATRVLVEYDKAGRGVGSAQQPRAEYAWEWTGEGLEVPATGPLGAYYAQRIASGELLVGDKDGSAPLAALAKARAAALAYFKAEQGESAETTEWADQFPLDLQAEAAFDIVAEQEKAASTKAAQDAAAAPGPARAPTVEERTAELRMARDEAKVSARKALGVKTSAAPPSNADSAPDAGPGITPALAKTVKKESDR